MTDEAAEYARQTNRRRRGLSEIADSLGLDFEPDAFKVWGEIEAQADPDQYKTVGEPVPLATFDTYDEANAFLAAQSLDGQGASDEARQLDPRGLLVELADWLADHADGAPDAPAWRKQAGVYAQQLKAYTAPRVLYLLKVWGDVEPSLAGPFATDAERLAAARADRRDEGDEHGLYRLDAALGAEVEHFSGAELDPDTFGPTP